MQQFDQFISAVFTSSTVRLFLITLFLQLFHKIEHLESFRTITYEVSRNSEFIFIRQNRTDIGIHEFFFYNNRKEIKKKLREIDFVAIICQKVANKIYNNDGET